MNRSVTMLVSGHLYGIKVTLPNDVIGSIIGDYEYQFGIKVTLPNEIIGSIIGDHHIQFSLLSLVVPSHK